MYVSRSLARLVICRGRSQRDAFSEEAPRGYKVFTQTDSALRGRSPANSSPVPPDWSQRQGAALRCAGLHTYNELIHSRSRQANVARRVADLMAKAVARAATGPTDMGVACDELLTGQWLIGSTEESDSEYMGGDLMPWGPHSGPIMRPHVSFPVPVPGLMSSRLSGWRQSWAPEWKNLTFSNIVYCFCKKK